MLNNKQDSKEYLIQLLQSAKKYILNIIVVKILERYQVN